MKSIKHTIQKMLTKQDGYLTIELTMIFPAIFLSLLLILFMGMVLYQEVTFQSLAVQASERGSVVYSSRVEDMTTGVKTLDAFEDRDPYRNIPGIDENKKKDYRSLINGYVSANLGKRDVIKGTMKNSGNYVTVDDYLISKRIRVNIKSEHKVPVDSMMEMFGLDGPFSVDTTAVAAVVDSPDFVRNVDLVMDMTKQTELFDNMEKGYNAIRSAIDTVTGWVK